MKDSEIIKALEIHSNDQFDNCEGCPYLRGDECTGYAVHSQPFRDILDLINRQKAEIAKLEKVEKYADKTIKTQAAEIERLEKARQKQAQFLGEERGQKYELLNKSDIEYQRETKKIDEAEKLAKISYAKRTEYAQLLKPYEGKTFADVPMDILKKADSLLKEAQKADKEYCKLMDIQ